MKRPGKSPIAKKTDTVSAVVPIEIADAVIADAASEDVSESKVVCRILKKHYAPRLAKKTKAQRMKEAA
jgi:hypothetical protein